MGMNCCGDVLETRAHLQRQAKGGRQFRNAGSHSLNAKQKMIVGPGDNADEACFPLESHGAAVGTEGKEVGLDFDAGGLCRFGGQTGGDNLS